MIEVTDSKGLINHHARNLCILLEGELNKYLKDNVVGEVSVLACLSTLLRNRYCSVYERAANEKTKESIFTLINDLSPQIIASIETESKQNGSIR